MTESHPFTIKIDSDAESGHRYRWSIFEGGTLRDESVRSYATKGEAQADADKFMLKLVAPWLTRR